MNGTSDIYGNQIGWTLTISPGATLDAVVASLEKAGIEILNRTDALHILLVESDGVAKERVEAVEGVVAVEANVVITID
ncbi:hypothetical protein [Rhizobium leguminosarum]|uniref:hypothetical protein n=1 Tax=Rhizobium leguminosarum TaxID=384 RepID=UPI002E135CB7|nr:hypothetical protein U8Q02_41850 [Rhizobium leguminosarum]